MDLKNRFHRLTVEEGTNGGVVTDPLPTSGNLPIKVGRGKAAKKIGRSSHSEKVEARPNRPTPKSGPFQATRTGHTSTI